MCVTPFSGATLDPPSSKMRLRRRKFRSWDLERTGHRWAGEMERIEPEDRGLVVDAVGFWFTGNITWLHPVFMTSSPDGHLTIWALVHLQVNFAVNIALGWGYSPLHYIPPSAVTIVLWEMRGHGEVHPINLSLPHWFATTFVRQRETTIRPKAEGLDTFRTQICTDMANELGLHDSLG